MFLPAPERRLAKPMPATNHPFLPCMWTQRRKRRTSLVQALVLCPLNNYTFAAMDFLLGRGASDEHTLQGSVRNEQRRLSEKDMPPGGLRRFWVLDFVAPRSQPAAGMLPRRASPEPKIDATNV